MYTLILTVVTFGFLWDDRNVSNVQGFKSLKSCQEAGEKYKQENTKRFISGAKYQCIKVN